MQATTEVVRRKLKADWLNLGTKL